jgi:thiamine biosynthesis lipoprotein
MKNEDLKSLVCFLMFSISALMALPGQAQYTPILPLIKLEGRAQGTTYHISYYSNDSLAFKKSVDSLLKKIDSSLSTYLQASIISRINRNDSHIKADAHFKKVFERSMEISEITNGMFDITVAPVVNAWGFGFTKKNDIARTNIDSLLKWVGYKKVKLEGSKLVKQYAQTMLDMNAIAQGYTVDEIANLFDTRGVQSYIVELGGEVKAKGRKTNLEFWLVGIDRPSELDGGEYQAILQLENKALATSGNYRRYYEENGRKYAHIIDPRTGYPAKHTLLSATVVANDCMSADAFATAFMVMGYENTVAFLTAHPEERLEVILIYDDGGKWKTYISPSLQTAVYDLIEE